MTAGWQDAILVKGHTDDQRPSLALIRQCPVCCALVHNDNTAFHDQWHADVATRFEGLDGDVLELASQIENHTQGPQGFWGQTDADAPNHHGRPDIPMTPEAATNMRRILDHLGPRRRRR